MKGLSHTMEAVIAILLLTAGVFLLLATPLTTPEYEKTKFKLSTYSSLETIDTTGELRELVLKNDVAAIKNDLSRFVPYQMNYDVAIFNRTSNVTTVPNIDAKDIIVVSYFLSGAVGNYTPREVRVYLW
jgi:hypothetical protein